MGHEKVVNSTEVDGSGIQCLTASADGSAQVFDARCMGESSVIKIEDAAAGYAVNRAMWRAEHEVITCGDDYCMKRWDLRKFEDGPIMCFLGHTNCVRSMALSADKRFLISGDARGSVRVWWADEAEGLRGSHAEALAHAQQLISAERDADDDEDFEVRLSPAAVAAQQEADRLAALASERERMPDVQALLRLDGPRNGISAMAFGPAGGSSEFTVIYGSQDQKIRVAELDVQSMVGTVLKQSLDDLTVRKI